MKANINHLLLIITMLLAAGCRPGTKSYNMDVSLVVMADAGSNTVDDVLAVVKKRLTNLGLKEESIVTDTNGNRIHLILSGVTDTVELKRILTLPGKLELRETYESAEIFSFLAEADSLMLLHPEIVTSDQNNEKETELSELEKKIERERLIPDSLLSTDEWETRHPLFALLKPAVYADGTPQSGSMVGYARASDTAVVSDWLNMREIMAVMPANLRFVWSSSPVRGSYSDSIYELHAIKMSSDKGRFIPDGSFITSATVKTGNDYPAPIVQLSMNKEGGTIWSMMTRDNIGRCIAIIIDGRVISSPRVMSEIIDGVSEISANFSLEEASDLANILSSGCLPAAVVIEE